MNDNTKLLNVITRSRNFLERGYIKWRVMDGPDHGCAMGALVVGAGGRLSPMGGVIGLWTESARVYNIAIPYMNALCRKLYPELVGAEGPRPDNSVRDSFQRNPIVYINNQLGKEAILAVFDEAIRRLSPVVATVPVPVDWKVEEKGEGKRMNNSVLNLLKASRELLAQTYAKWYQTTPDGEGHCAYGAVLGAAGGSRVYESSSYKTFNKAIGVLETTARTLHPEMVDKKSPRRANGDHYDVFNDTPIAYVNNHTDRETTLAVFDAAIASLEGIPVPAEMKAPAQVGVEVAK